QAAGVPVYYRHERFPTVIAFPPLPLSFDTALWRRHRNLFTALDAGRVPRAALPAWDERLSGLVDVTAADGGGWLELTAAGQLFHDACRTG
ncbi:MAG TPA: hypothetical protein VH092_12520, partial [Urbifossiella sp.]|nr:hypothetical protein [Urbifossiella sp.]